MVLALAISLAVVSGICGTLSAVAISYPAHVASVQKIEQTFRSRAVSGIANIVLTGLATLLGILACGHGPVAIVFPFAVAAGLTSNMIVQVYLKLAQYGKTVRVGTYMLIVAVILISQMGPKEMNAGTDVLSLLLATPALTFSLFSLLTMVGSICALRFKWVTSNNASLFLYILVGGTGTVLNTSISKMIQMDLGLTVKLPLGILYLILAVTCVGSAVRANSVLDDPSLFVPISNGMNLILNCVAGLCIWDDMSRLRTTGLSYFMIYMIVILGTYLVSAFDLFQLYAMNEQASMVAEVGQRSKAEPLLTRPRAETLSIRASLKKLDFENLDESMLEEAIEKSVISHKDIVTLLLKDEVRPLLDELIRSKNVTVQKQKKKGQELLKRSLSRGVSVLQHATRTSRIQSFELFDEGFSEQQPKQATHTFKPGVMGITYDAKGSVQEVSMKSPAHTMGITVGDRIVKVGAEPFSKKALGIAERSGIDYEVTVQVCEQIGGSSFEDNWGNFVTVEQAGSSVKFVYQGQVKAGSLSGNTLTIPGWAGGTVSVDGNVRFFDGGMWTKKAFPLNIPIFIRSHRNDYLQDDNGSVRFSRTACGGEKWTLVDAGNGKVVIKSHRNQNLQDDRGMVRLSESALEAAQWRLRDAGNGKIIIEGTFGKNLNDDKGVVGLSENTLEGERWSIVQAD